MQRTSWLAGSLLTLALTLAASGTLAQQTPPTGPTPKGQSPQGSSAPATAAPAPDSAAASAPVAELPPAVPSAPGEREALIEEGLRLRRENKDQQAFELFQRAAELGRDARVTAQIAFAEQAMGRWADAYTHLKDAIADSNDPWVQQHAEFLKEQLKAIEANTGRLEVRTNIAVSRLTIDGKQVDVSHLGEPFIVPAGSVVVSAEAPGYLPTTRHVPVYAGSLSRAELVLVNEPTVAQRSRVEEEKLRRNPAWLYVAGAGALVSLASIGPWVSGNNLADDLKKNCSMPNSCTETFADDDKKVRRLDNATTALLAGGLSVAALSIASYFIFTQKDTRPKVTPSAWIAPGTFGLTAHAVY